MPSDHIFLQSFFSFLHKSNRTLSSTIPSGISTTLPLKVSSWCSHLFLAPFSFTPLLQEFSCAKLPTSLLPFSFVPLLQEFSCAKPPTSLLLFSFVPPLLKFSCAEPPSSLVPFSNAPPISSFSARLLLFLALLWYVDLTPPFLFQVVQYIYPFQFPQVF